MIKEPVELWVKHPVYDFLEGSSFGNSRTTERYTVGKDGKVYHSYGTVLTAYDRGGGYLEVGFSKDGKRIHMLLHQLIAQCFIPNPNSLLEINHKDCNPSNNEPSNLEWVSRQYNVEYREKCGTSAAEALGRPLWAYNLNTGDKSHFTTQREAERKTGVDYSSINMVIKGKRKQAGGYYFTEDENKVTKERLQAIKAGMLFLGGIIAINLETLEVLRFKSQCEAARQLDCSQGHIGSVIRGQRNHTGGYWFCHADSNAIESTRAKFGNEIADKVGELLGGKEL